MCPGLAEPNNPLACISADMCVKFCDNMPSVSTPPQWVSTEFSSRLFGDQFSSWDTYSAMRQIVVWTSCSLGCMRYNNKQTRLTALPGWAGTRKVVSGSGISWAICKSAPRSRQITMPAPHHLVFLPARCPSYHPTNSIKALKAMRELWTSCSLGFLHDVDRTTHCLGPNFNPVKGQV